LELDDNLETPDDDSEMLDDSETPDDDSETLDDNNLETLESVVIDLPEGSERAFTTQVPRILVIPTYENFWDILQDEDRRWQAPLSQTYFYPSHATIVTGQPGIGQ
jgi:hypothetical protein